EPVSALFPDEAYEFGYGENIVDVTFVDIRAWDTMGEISVLLAAATGVAALLFIKRRTAVIERASDALSSSVWEQRYDTRALLALKQDVSPSKGRGRQWLYGGQSLSPTRRSVILEMVTRLVFHTMIIFAIYLL